MPTDIKLKDYGRLIRDGELRIKDHSTMKIRSRYVFVFDQVVIMCKSKVCSNCNCWTRLTVVKLVGRPVQIQRQYPSRGLQIRGWLKSESLAGRSSMEFPVVFDPQN